MIDRKDIQKIAHFAKLELTEHEMDKMAGEVISILDMFEELHKIDTEGVQPTFYGNSKMNVFRDDQPILSGKKEALLDNAPDSKDGYIRVPIILDKEEA